MSKPDVCSSAKHGQPATWPKLHFLAKQSMSAPYACSHLCTALEQGLEKGYDYKKVLKAFKKGAQGP